MPTSLLRGYLYIVNKITLNFVMWALWRRSLLCLFTRNQIHP
ncbi:hypothetical protein [Anabaena azotica]|nr:hypothetical protein [Anabaena azotica]